MMPETIADPSPQPGDEDLVALAGRRTTFEWVLRRAVLAQPHVELRDGVHVTGLTFAATDAAADAHGPPGAAPRWSPACGAPTATSRSASAPTWWWWPTAAARALPAWLAEAGVEIREHEEDTGIVYFSQFYRLRDGAEYPPQVGPTAGNLEYLKFGLFLGDNRTFSVTLACATGDRELRTRLTDPATFAGHRRSHPRARRRGPTPSWPIPSPRSRSWPGWSTAGAGSPTPTAARWSPGWCAVGDAHTCTNPLYGRGCSLAMVQADALVDALADARRRPAWRRAPTYEAAVARRGPALVPGRRGPGPHGTGRGRRTAGRSPPSGEPAASRTGPHRRRHAPDQMRALLRDGVFPALRVDAVVFRAFLRMFNLLTTPDALVVDPDVLGRVMPSSRTARTGRPNRRGAPIARPSWPPSQVDNFRTEPPPDRVLALADIRRLPDSAVHAPAAGSTGLVRAKEHGTGQLPAKQTRPPWPGGRTGPA